MSVSLERRDLLASRIDLAYDLAERQARAGNYAKADRYMRSAETLEFIDEAGARESRVAFDKQLMRMAWHNHKAVQNPRRDK